MSRKKKTRRLKDKLSVKTGSKKNFLAPGQKGQIPSKNKLAKHKKRTKSAYQKYLEEQGLTDTSGQGQPFPEGATDQPTDQRNRPAPTRPDLRKRKPDSLQPKPLEEDDQRDFEELTGDDLWDLLDRD